MPTNPKKKKKAVHEKSGLMGVCIGQGFYWTREVIPALRHCTPHMLPSPLSTNRPFNKKKLRPDHPAVGGQDGRQNVTAIFLGQKWRSKKGALLLYQSIKGHFFL